MDLKDLVKKLLRNNKDADLATIEKAYAFAKEVYKGEKRYSGDTTLDHTLESAIILADLKLAEKSIVACLLHHCLDRGVRKEKIKREFGEEVAEILTGLKKIKKLKLMSGKEEANPSDIRKVLLAATKDIRALLIKLAIKLHNMRTLASIPDEGKKKRIAHEVLNLYAPLAYRLGVGSIKSELEDLAFSYTDPKEYKAIVDTVAETKQSREHRIYAAKKKIEQSLKKSQIKAEIHGRVKHIYSIYRKILDRDYDIDDIKDFTALRIITESVEDCYNTLRIVHELWQPFPGTFKDYIAMPKTNGYQSLHTVVLGPNGKAIEFQLRTKEMHEVAEEGFAVHYGYKGVVHGKEFDKKLRWLKQFVKKGDNNFQIDLFSDVIFVFTPKGKLIELPRGATPLDFAYHIHSDVGEKATGVNINGKYSPLKTELENGDVVDIITSKNQRPSMDWLKIVRTAKARNKIRTYLKSHGKTVVLSGGVVAKQEELRKELEESLIEVPAIREPMLKVAVCCKPLPGDRITGFKIGRNRVTIHKGDCDTIRKHKTGPKKEVKAQWLEHSNSLVEIIIEAGDRTGLFAEILNTVADLGFNVDNPRGKALDHDKAQCKFIVNVKSRESLMKLISRIKRIKSVTHVYIGDMKKINA